MVIVFYNHFATHFSCKVIFVSRNVLFLVIEENLYWNAESISKDCKLIQTTMSSSSLLCSNSSKNLKYQGFQLKTLFFLYLYPVGLIKRFLYLNDAVCNICQRKMLHVFLCPLRLVSLFCSVLVLIDSFITSFSYCMPSLTGVL